MRDRHTLQNYWLYNELTSYIDGNPTISLSSTHYWLDFWGLMSPRIFGDPLRSQLALMALILFASAPILIHWNSKLYLIQESSHFSVGEGALSKLGRYSTFCCWFWNRIASDILHVERLVPIWSQFWQWKFGHNARDQFWAFSDSHQLLWVYFNLLG